MASTTGVAGRDSPHCTRFPIAPDFSAFLATRPSTAHTMVSLLVVSAYAGEDYLPALIKVLAPARSVVVLDESSPDDLVAAISRAVGKAGRIWLGRASKLMHAKVYLLGWRRPGSSRIVFRLIFGSANASDSGFAKRGGNAESLAWLAVSPTANPELFAWAESISQAESPVSIGAAEERISDLRLFLPGFGLRSPKDIPAFDAWLQRGRLLHPFERDPGFLRLPVALKKALPLGGPGDALAAAGLLPPEGGRYMHWAYLGRGESTGRTPPPWKARHFVETVLGPWTSDRCFAKKGHLFVLAGDAERKKEIDRVAGATEGQRELWANAFVTLVAKAAGNLGKDEVVEYFETNPHGLDPAHYSRAAGRQLTRDHQRACDPEFVRRFVAGVQILRVPRFRDDEEAWEEFAKSLATTLLLQLNKGRRTNALARVVAESEVLDDAEDGAAALAILRNTETWEALQERIEALLAEGFEEQEAE